MSLLRVGKINKSFDSLNVIKNVSLNVDEGERHVIIGPNGAGKTTFFNCITGFLPIDSGTVQIDGQNTEELSPYHHVHLGMSRTFQKNNLFENLTVKENIRLAIASSKSYRFQSIKPLSYYRDLNEETIKLLKQWDFTNRMEIKVKNLSYGEQRLIEIMLAMASNPRILLLDEPTSGMSPAETKQTTEMILNLPRKVTLLIIEHDMEVVFSIADKITVLHHGELLISGAPEDIRNSDHIQEIYFGGGKEKNA